MRKIIILKHNGGRLGNQLWNYISIYAYCLEKKNICLNYSFYKYDKYFNIKNNGLFYRFFLRLYRLAYLLKLDRYIDKIYNRYVKLIKNYNQKKIIYSDKYLKDGVFYLPPTPTAQSINVSAINNILDRSSRKLYLVYIPGWPFRNPVGIEKYRSEIKKYFLPKKYIRQPVENFMNSLRKKYKHVVGVHIRQDDYKNKFMEGKLYFNQNQVSKILRQYLSRFNRTIIETCFVICSDGPVNQELFKNLNIKMTSGDVIKDLYSLSLADIIIGSDSTFGSFASYYGNIPHIILDKDGIDWSYYKDKNKYFINKYSTVTNIK